MAVQYIAAGISLGKGIVDMLSQQRAGRKQAKRYQHLMTRIDDLRERSIKRGVEEIGGQTQGLLAQGRTAAARRASAMGMSDAEPLMLPMEAQISRAGGDAMRQYMQGIQGKFDSAELEAEFGYAARPIQESPMLSLADTVLGLGAGALQFNQDQNYANILGNAFKRRQDLLNQQFGSMEMGEPEITSPSLFKRPNNLYGKDLRHRSPLYGGGR